MPSTGGKIYPWEASYGQSSAPQVVARMAKSANDRHWHGAVPVLIGAVALAVMPVFMSRVAWAAFTCLSIGAFGIWAVHGPLMSWPAVILSGTNAASGESSEVAHSCRPAHPPMMHPVGLLQHSSPSLVLHTDMMSWHGLSHLALLRPSPVRHI